jgi:hypothetical protein
MMKKRHKGKKAITAVGAVVTAGLTPGIIVATPACMPGQNPNALITAAEVVAIDGNAYSFDELYAMQQRSNRDADPQVATRYGVQPYQQSTYYGVQRPRQYLPPQPYPQEIKERNIQIALDTIQLSLMEYCAWLINADSYGIIITPDSDLTRELKMKDGDLKALKAEIEKRYGVEVSYHRFKLVGQLNTLRLITEYIVKLKTVWDKPSE